MAVVLALTTGRAWAAPGDLDTTFGSAGKLVQPIGPRHAQLLAATLQPDGNVVAAGFAEQSATAPHDRDFLLVRLNADGSFDSGFGGGDGIVTQPVSGGAQDDTANAVALGPGGTIYAAGTTDPAGAGDSADFAIARFTSAGLPDTGFSADAVQTHSVGTVVDGALALAVQPADGKPVLAGPAGSTANGFHVLRLDATTGALDASFNAGGATPGRHEIDFTAGFGFDFASALALQGDRILVAGTANASSADADLALARLESDGTLDTAGFGAGTGTVQTARAGKQNLNALTLDGDGRIVVAGSEGFNPLDFLVARYGGDGAIDNSFDGDGVQTTPFVAGDGTRFARAAGVGVQADGRIVAGGSAFTCASAGCADFALARYASNGSLDSSFGSGGTKTQPIGSNNDFANALLLQPLGSEQRAILAGVAVGSELAAFGAFQLSGSTAPPPTTTPPPPPLTADLEAKLHNVTRIGSGQPFAYSLAVTNHGPAEAERVTVTNLLPPGLDPSLVRDRFLCSNGTDFVTEEEVVLEVDVAEVVVTVLRPLGPGETRVCFFPLRATARPGTTVVNTATARSDTPEPEPNHFPNSASDTIDVYAVPDSNIRSVGAEAVAGSAGASGRGSRHVRASDFEPGLARLRRVDVAILRRSSRGCQWLRERRARFRSFPAEDGRCPPRIWLQARGTRRWRLALARRLAPGRYTVYTRAVNGAGVAETEFSRGDRNLRSFRVAGR
jgi:uncharacterized delta-60 repeat protein/uncharacterized repeat protein (TIGR01451 family)